MYLLLALAASAGYGAADFFGGVASRRAALVPVILISQALALVLVLFVSPFLATVPDLSAFLWGSAAGVAYSAGLILLYRGLAEGQMSVVAPVTGVCALGSPVLFGLILGEKPGVWALVGIVLALGAIVLISSAEASGEAAAKSGAEGEERAIARRSVVMMAVGAGIAIGLFFIALARTKPEAGLWPLVATRGVTVSCYLAVTLATKQSLRIPRGSLNAALACGTLDICANSLYLLAVRGGMLSLAATFTSLYPATTVLLAGLVLREKISRSQAFGLVCAAMAVLLITMTQAH